jgi:hypothetical protein
MFPSITMDNLNEVIMFIDKAKEQIPLIVLSIFILVTVIIEFFVFKRIDLLPANIPILLLVLLYVVVYLYRRTRGHTR